VAQAALLVDAVGSVNEVTLTALAAALDIRVPSLYNHIAGLDDLHLALTVHALQLFNTDLRAAVVGRVGQDALLALATAYRRFAIEHPGLYPLTLRGPGNNATSVSARDAAMHVSLAQELLQMLLLIMASLGLEGEDAIHAVRGLRALLHGFTSLEAGEAFKMAVDRDASFRRMIMTYLAGLAAIKQVI
jgi:AcrR family transcriptional regulator